MKILDLQKIRIYMFLDRCYLMPGYSILIYTKDFDLCCDLNDEIMDYYKSKDSEIKGGYLSIHPQVFVDVDDSPFESYNQLNFDNGSKIIIAPLNAWLTDQQAHVVIFDSHIKRDIVESKLKPTIIPYELENGAKIVNPKLLKLLTSAVI